MKVYGSPICMDCRNYLAIQAHRGFAAEFVDITENTANLKAFLTLRDQDPAFKPVIANGGIGIPAFVSDSGAVTTDINEAMAWLGLPPIDDSEIAEK